MTPVVLLTDGFVANGSGSWKLPNLDLSLIHILQAADNKLRSILANEAPADSAAVDSTAAPVVAQATSTADSLAAALKGENKAQSVDLAQIKKEHPLLAVSL